MSYRFISNANPLRGYAGTTPTVVHCLYDVTGAQVQSLYMRDPLRYGGDGTNVCYRSSSFTPPPRVPVPTSYDNTCIQDLYGRTIYDIYGMPVCYVPKIRTVTVSPLPAPTPVPTATPVPAPESPVPVTATPPETTATPVWTAPQADTTTAITPMAPPAEAPPEAPPEAPMDLPGPSDEEEESTPDENNKVLIGGILALLVVGAGVAYLKFKKS